MSPTLQLTPLAGFPLVEPGDDLAALIADNVAHNRLQLEDDDLLVIAQKIVSKAENRFLRLSEVQPGARAREVAQEVDKDPRLVEAILGESREIVRMRRGVIITRHHNGYVHANAGIDQSNIATDEADPQILLLPENPDLSAARLRAALKDRLGVSPNILINDSAGRPWRNGIAGFALGTAGFEPIDNRVGKPDLYGRELQVTEIAVADELAAAASFVMGQGDEGIPVVMVRGARLTPSDAGSETLIRPLALDLFR